MTKTHTTLLGAACALLLSACGGGGNSTPAGGTLTLSATTPAALATTLDLAMASTAGNSARPADAFSAQPYCEVFWENVAGANGKKYAVQVYFRQGDKAPLHLSVVEVGSGWAVYSNNSGAAITGLTIDTSARSIAFANKVLAGATTEAGTVAGTASFEANKGTPACGA
jgi:hypothetical protein